MMEFVNEFLGVTIGYLAGWSSCWIAGLAAKRFDKREENKHD